MLLSTRFPYTTLFRSDDVDNLHGVVVAIAQVDARLVVDQLVLVARQAIDRFTQGPHRAAQRSQLALHAVSLGDRRTVWIGDEDRKSTRLNSSHLGISYAALYTLSLHDALPI